MGNDLRVARARPSRTRGLSVAEKMRVNEQWAVSLLYTVCVCVQIFWSNICFNCHAFLIDISCSVVHSEACRCSRCVCPAMPWWCMSCSCARAAHRWPCCLDLNFLKGRLMIWIFLAQCVSLRFDLLLHQLLMRSRFLFFFFPCWSWVFVLQQLSRMLNRRLWSS